MIEVHIRTKAIWIAANDGKHQRQIVVSRANDGFRTATDPNPGLERAAFDRRKYALIGEGRARLEDGVTVPRDQQREIVRLLYVATRHQVKALAAVLELDGLE